MFDNPLIPGDPYMYDIKWIVSKILQHGAELSNLDEKIRAAVIAALDQHDPIYFESADALINSGIKAGALAYIEGYYAPGDGGANLYITTDDYNDIIGVDFYITLSGPNKWAIPIILSPFVTPEMFGAVCDGITNDAAAIETAINTGKPVIMKANSSYKSGTANIKAPATVIGFNTIIELVIPDGRHETFIKSDGYNVNAKGLHFVGVPHATSLGTDPVNAIFDISNADIVIDNCIFDTVQPWNFRNAPIAYADRDCSLIKCVDGNLTIKDSTITNCRNQEMIYMIPDVNNVDKKGVFKNIILNNNDYSIDALCKDIEIENISGNHTYDGSVFNVFALNNLEARNIHIDIDTAIYPNSNVLDNTEGGLFYSQYVSLFNVQGDIRLGGANIHADNCGTISINLNNNINTALSPLTQKSAFSKVIWYFNDIDLIGRTGTTMLDVNTELEASINNSTTNALLVPQNTTIQNKFRATNSYITLPISRADVMNEMILNNCNIIGYSVGYSGYVADYAILFGCYAHTPISLYHVNVGADPLCYACHNITP